MPAVNILFRLRAQLALELIFEQREGESVLRVVSTCIVSLCVAHSNIASILAQPRNADVETIWMSLRYYSAEERKEAVSMAESEMQVEAERIRREIAQNTGETRCICPEHRETTLHYMRIPEVCCSLEQYLLPSLGPLDYLVTLESCIANKI